MSRADPTRAAAGHMPFAGHRSQAEIAGALRQAQDGGGHRPPRVMAMYRPALGDIFVVTSEDGAQAGTALAVAEARAIHAALGRALAVAEHAKQPLRAVKDETQPASAGGGTGPVSGLEAGAGSDAGSAAVLPAEQQREA